jgi:hypothetical protein
MAEDKEVATGAIVGDTKTIGVGTTHEVVIKGDNNNTKATGVVTKAIGVAHEAVVMCPFPVEGEDKVP